MSESPAEPELPDVSDADIDRTDVLDNLEDVMDEAVRKSINGRIRDPENERVRIKWSRAFVSAASEYRHLSQDIEESEQEARIERLESLVDDLDSG